MAEVYWFAGHEQFQPEVLVEHAKLAEAAGFDGVMVSEHFHPWVADAGAGGFAFATLGAMAQVTTSVKLMTAVTTPLFRYHPALVAQAAATIDRLSGGRFALGIGTGENINEGPLGYTFSAYAERAERLSEAIAIIKGLLAGEKLDFAGRYYKTSSAKLYSPAVSPVPVYVAAGGPKTAKLAGQLADGVIASVKDVNETRAKVIEPARKEAKGDFVTVTTRWSVYAQDDEEAWQALQPWRGLRAPDRLSATDPAQLQQAADQLPRKEVLERYSRVSSADDYVEAYGPLITELGADIVGIQTTASEIEPVIAMLGAEVVPKLHTLNPNMQARL